MRTIVENLSSESFSFHLFSLRFSAFTQLPLAEAGEFENFVSYGLKSFIHEGKPNRARKEAFQQQESNSNGRFLIPARRDGSVKTLLVHRNPSVSWRVRTLVIVIP